MSAGTLGVVVVGAGHGCRVHVPAARNAGLDVVGVVGRDRDKTAKRAARVGVDLVFTSLEQALKVPGTDAVIISTPPHTHAALTEEAIGAGRHVLVEKPFTVDAAEARRLQALAEHAGVVALVGHEFRFSADRMTLRGAITDGVIGTPRLATFVGHNAFAAPLDWPEFRGPLGDGHVAAPDAGPVGLPVAPGAAERHLQRVGVSGPAPGAPPVAGRPGRRRRT